LICHYEKFISHSLFWFFVKSGELKTHPFVKTFKANVCCPSAGGEGKSLIIRVDIFRHFLVDSTFIFLSAFQIVASTNPPLSENLYLQTHAAPPRRGWKP
jgi:hypothetical protein